MAARGTPNGIILLYIECFFSGKSEKHKGKDVIDVANRINFRHEQCEQKGVQKKSLKMSISCYNIIVLLRGPLKIAASC
jgi:hypothetical protein